MTQAFLTTSLAKPLAPLGFSHAVRALIADGGEHASCRYIEFFAANVRNSNTRRAYARICGQFFGWREERGPALRTIRWIDVATYIETLRRKLATPSVKQQLTAIRTPFDRLLVDQIVSGNPAASVRGPKYVVKVGKTPVLDDEE